MIYRWVCICKRAYYPPCNYIPGKVYNYSSVDAWVEVFDTRPNIGYVFSRAKFSECFIDVREQRDNKINQIIENE